LDSSQYQGTVRVLAHHHNSTLLSCGTNVYGIVTIQKTIVVSCSALTLQKIIKLPRLPVVADGLPAGCSPIHTGDISHQHTV
jgi:hypothetical protein